MPALDPSRLVVLLMAGGSGTRLWPLSRRGRAKQFVSLVGGRTLLEATYERALLLVPNERIFVNVTGGNGHWVEALLPMLPRANIIEAPEDRDTLPTIGFATLAIERQVANPTLLLLASDNWIDDPGALRQVLADAARAAQAGPHLVSVGIVPTHASTQYGYMHLGEREPALGASAFYGLGYHEKPSAARAEELFSGGVHDWNSGMFAWDAATFWSAARAFVPDDVAVFDELRTFPPDSAEKTRAAFARLRKIAVDHGILERVGKTTRERHVFVRANQAWDDIGHYQALARYMDPDARGNRVRGHVQLEETSESTVFAADGTRVRVRGLKDLIVSADGGHVLVAARSSYAKVRELAGCPITVDLGDHVRGFVRTVGSSDNVVEADGRGIVALLDVHGLTVRVENGCVDVSPSKMEEARVSTMHPTARGVGIFVGEDHDEMSQMAAAMLASTLAATVAERGRAIAIFSAGRTPGGVYAALRTVHRTALDWRKVTLVQMDEYAEVEPASAATFESFLRRELVLPLDLEFRPLAGGSSAKDLVRHEAWALDAGIDVVLHGIGANGHLGFNEPGSAFDSQARIAELTRETRAAAAPAFGGIDHTPRCGPTLGLAALSSAKKIVLLASGPTKTRAIRRALMDEPTIEVPASVLQQHPDVKVFLDLEAAAGLVRRGEVSS